MRAVIPILFAALLTLGASSSSAWQASGRFQYTDRLYDISSFTGVTTKPVREADVQLYDLNSQAVISSTATDSNGDFSMTIADVTQRDLGIRVLSSANETPSLDLRVMDDLNGYAVFVYHDAATDQLAHTSADVDFGTMTMPLATGAIGSTDWSSQVFNIYDMGVVLADWVASVDGSRPAMAFSLVWNPTSERSDSYYIASTNRVFVSDDDGYDDPNILHELGHFVEDEYSHSSSPSGIHFIGDNDQDPRLAWSEGLSTFFSNAALEQEGLPRPDLYVDHDSFAVGPGPGFGYSVESGAAGASGGSTSEVVVSAALWDIIDQAATDDDSVGVDDDPMSDPAANVWTVLEAFRVSLPAHTQMEDFWETWFNEGLGSATDLTTIFTIANIDFVADGQEPNDDPASATPLAVNGAYLENSFYRNGIEAAGDEDWFSFSAIEGTHYRISINGANGAIFGRPDPELFLLDPVLEVLAFNDAPHDTQLNLQSDSFAQDMAETAPSILWRAPESGSYLIYVRHASHRRNLDGRYGTYQIRVTSEISPAPIITQIAAQTMRPGQSYQVLILGSNFARDAQVTLQDPGIGVADVAWMGPTALAATLDVAPAGVSDGSYLVQVSNPGGGSSQLPAAIDVSSTAAPPVAISEVELGADRVEIRNLGTVDATLTGWQISSYRPTFPASTYTFPVFTLPAGETVVVSEDTGTNTASELFDQTFTVNWPWFETVGGGVSLIDASGRNVDYIRFVDSPVDDHEAPLGTNGAWLHPDVQSPTAGFAIARDEASSILRTRRGISWAQLSMPVGTLGRANATDRFEDNETPRRATLMPRNVSIADLEISPRSTGTDVDWFAFPIAAGTEVVFDALFAHASGNLNMLLYPPGNDTFPFLASNSLDDDERIVLSSGLSSIAGSGVYRLRVFGSAGATNTYTLHAKQTSCGDGVIDLSEQCDDGNVADGDCCSASCQYEILGASCEDGNACTLPGICNSLGVCFAGGPLVCNDGNVCTDDSCDPGIGCVAAPNTASCDDGNACTTLDVCATGVCIGGPPASCDDANPCTDDGCDPGLGCTTSNNTAPCEDGNACTELDVCQGGTCTPGSALGCDDANVCTDDGCDPGTGCTYVGNTLACSDDDACTTGDVCSAGLCVAPGALDCDDMDVCTADSCDQISGCVNTPIEGCPTNVPLGSSWLTLALATLLVGAGVFILKTRRVHAVTAGHDEARWRTRS